MNKALCEFTEDLVDKATGDLNIDNVTTYMNQLGSGRKMKSQNERDINMNLLMQGSIETFSALHLICVSGLSNIKELQAIKLSIAFLFLCIISNTYVFLIIMKPDVIVLNCRFVFLSQDLSLYW